MRNLLTGGPFRLRYPYDDPIERLRAQVLVVLAGLTSLTWLLPVFAVVLALFSDEAVLSGETLVLLVGPVASLSVYFAVQTGRLLGASLLTVFALLNFSLFALNLDGVNSAGMLLVALTLVITAILLDWRGFLATALVLLLGIFLVTLGQYATAQAMLDDDLATVLLNYVSITGLLLAFNASTRQFVRQSLESLDQLRAIGRFNDEQVEAEETDVYLRLIRTLRTRLDFRFVQVFLVNAQGLPDRRVRTGLGYSDQISTTNVTIGERNVLTRAARERKSLQVSRMAEEPQRAHLLPSANYAVAVPVIIDGQTVAVIDIQDNNQPFTSGQVEALNVLASQSAGALRAVRTIRDMRASLISQEITITNMRARLRESRQDAQSSGDSAWFGYLEHRGDEAVGFDLNTDAPEGQTFTPARDLPDPVRKALARGDVVTDSDGDQPLMLVPIRLQDEVLGAMVLRLAPDAQITDRQLETARSVAGRLALALENKRLYEQSQSQAARERQASEVGNLLLTATDVDAVLNLAADSFNEALGSIRTRIYVEPDMLSSPATYDDDTQPETASQPVETDGG